MYSRITRFRASRSGLLRSSAVKSPLNKEVSELIQSKTTRQDVFVRNLRFMPVKRWRKFGSTNRRGPFMLFTCVLYALPLWGSIRNHRYPLLLLPQVGGNLLYQQSRLPTPQHEPLRERKVDTA